MLAEHGGAVIEEVDVDFMPEEVDSDSDSVDGPVRPVYWVTEVGEINQLASAYIHYGNEGVLNHLYMTVCLTVDVGPVGDRTAPPITV
ncbi:hypothetical protein C8T65DRAFT_643075 [Cerioporus squamosus]|nr:hypothetical protein C8T65DRAFT_643075 [Cerioporus squamosus]